MRHLYTESRAEPPLRLRHGLARRAAAGSRLGLRLALVLACFPCANAPAQSLELNQYAHRTLRTSDLALVPGAQRIRFAQTPDGYLWLGTNLGLYRFDGVRAVRWPSSDGSGLPFAWIWSLHTSRDGTLWIGGATGLATWRDGKITLHSSAAGQQVTSIFEDSRGVLWLGLRENISLGAGDSPRLCTIREGVFSCERDERFGSMVRDVFEDRGGRIWVVSTSGVWRWAPGQPQYYPLPGRLPHAVEDEDGAIIAANDNGLRRLERGVFQPYQIPGVRGRFGAGKLFRTRDGSLWISSPDFGLYHTHRGKTDRFTAADGLSSDRVYGFFEDREGNVWVDTGNGIDQFHPVAAPRLPSTMGLSSATVWSVLATPDSSVWLATPTGLNRWRDGRVTVYADAAPNDREATGALRRVPKGDVQSPVYSLGLDARGRVWASTMHGLAHLSDGQFAPVRGGLAGAAFSIAGDRRGDVWANYQFVGLYRWTPGDTVRRVMRFSQNTMAAMTRDSQRDGLWAGQQGVGIIYLDSGLVRETYSPFAHKNSPSNDLRMGSDGVLWSASADGLTRMKNLRGTTLNSRNGLPCDFVHWSIEDDYGWLWMRMSCGLVRVARTELDAWVRDSSKRVAVQKFGRYAATTDDQFGAKFYYRPAVTKASDGRIWFADVEGAGVIDPRIVPFNDRPPPVYVERITADSTTYDAPMTSGNHVRLPPRVRNVRIEYTALSLTAPERVRFRFMLEGQDPDWREAVNRRSVEYSNLSPGPYRFRVTAANNDGVWNTTGATLAFTVEPAWNQAWWFFVLAASLIALTPAGAVVAWQRRRNRLATERTQARFEAMLAERTRVARELHDTLLGDMAGVAMQLSAGAKRVDTLGGARGGVGELLSTLSTQVQRTLVEARHSVSAMRAVPGQLPPLHEQLASAAQRTLGEADMKVRVEHAGQPRACPPTVETEIVGIATEAMTNARNHAGCQEMTVTCNYGPRALEVRVRDNGRGFDASQAAPAGHWGLVGMRERAASIGATLSVSSSPETGTEVVIAMPVEPR
jgi:signal transduction histidine kinase